MQISTVIGTISKERDLDHEVNGEEFYLTTLTMDHVSIPMLCSGLVLKDLYGKAEITGYFATRYSRRDGGKCLFTYLHAADVIPLEENIADVNCINIHAKVTKVHGFTITRNGKEILPLVGKYTSNDGNTSVVHMCAVGGAARKVRDIEPQQYIVGNGFIKPRGISYEIILTRAEIEEKEVADGRF